MGETGGHGGRRSQEGETTGAKSEAGHELPYLRKQFGGRCSQSKVQGTSQMTAKRSQKGGLVGSTGTAVTLAFIQMKRETFRGWAKKVLALTFF